MCGGRGHNVSHFMELFLIPLGASIGYLCVCVCVCVVPAGALCVVALWWDRSSSVCGSSGRASITELCTHSLPLSVYVRTYE